VHVACSSPILHNCCSSYSAQLLHALMHEWRWLTCPLCSQLLHQLHIASYIATASTCTCRYYISKGQRLKAPFPEEAIWRIFLQLAK
jgi:hypothetical protein